MCFTITEAFCPKCNVRVQWFGDDEAGVYCCPVCNEYCHHPDNEFEPEVTVILKRVEKDENTNCL